MATRDPAIGESVQSISTMGTDNEYTVDLKQVVRVIQKRGWLIALVVIMLVGATLGLSMLQTPMYEASIKILVGQERATLDSAREDVTNLQQLTRTMSEAINSRPVAEAAIEQLNLQTTADDLLENLSVGQIGETQMIEVSYRDPSPETAYRTANVIGEVFSEQILDANPSASRITATVWEPAEVPSEPASPQPIRNGLVALVLGLMLALGLVLVLEYLDDTWSSPEEAEEISGLPTFGVIPTFHVSMDKQKGKG